MTESQPPSKNAKESRLTLSQLVDTLGAMSDTKRDPELELFELSAGQVLFEQGDDGDSVFVLVAGILGVRVRHGDGSETDIDRLAPGAIVGEMAVLSGQKRSATVYAINDAGLIRLSRSKFAELAEADLADVVAQEVPLVPRWQRLQLVKVLNKLFDNLDVDLIHQLQALMEWQHHSNGSIVFRQGESSDGLYIVVNGRLRVTTVSPGGEEEVLGEIGPGETLGEFGVLTDEPRSATVYAIRESNLVKLTPDVFWKLTRDNPSLIAAITRVIVERQQRMILGRKAPQTGAHSIALLPGSPGVDVYAFARQLAGSLGQYGETVAVDAQRFDELYGHEGACQVAVGDPSFPAIVDWLSQLEADHDFVIFAADDRATAWTSHCTGQADRVLIVARPDGDPSPRAAEAGLEELEVPIRKELVLWHPAGTDFPSGTAAWLETRQVRHHYHVREGDRSHMDRLARRLSGRAVGVVFSGGGARGYAHLGVYRAFLELGIPIDYVGGTSMGSIISTSVARGFSYAESVELAHWTADYKVTDITLPITAINASKHVTNICKKLCDDILIEDLWLPFFCVSSNLSLAEPVVHTRGPMWRAVRASMSIPGVFTPVMEGDEVLVDGAPLNNFPTDVMTDLCESDYLVGVSVSPYRESKRAYDFDTSISGWRVLFSRLNPFSKSLRAPSMFKTMHRAMEINSVHRIREREQLVDLLISPDVKEFSVSNFALFQPLADIGYQTAVEPLRAWKTERLRLD